MRPVSIVLAIAVFACPVAASAAELPVVKVKRPTTTVVYHTHRARHVRHQIHFGYYWYQWGYRWGGTRSSWYGSSFAWAAPQW